MRPPSLHGRGFVVTLRVFGESAPSDLGAVLELEALSLVLDHGSC